MVINIEVSSLLLLLIYICEITVITTTNIKRFMDDTSDYVKGDSTNIKPWQQLLSEQM